MTQQALLMLSAGMVLGGALPRLFQRRGEVAAAVLALLSALAATLIP